MAERLAIVAYAYELIPGDLVVDTWEETSREVESVVVAKRDVTVTFIDGSTETTTMRPGSQVIYDVMRLREKLPPPSPLPQPAYLLDPDLPQMGGLA